MQTGPARNALCDVLNACAGHEYSTEKDEPANTTVDISAEQFSTHFPAVLSARTLLRDAQSFEVRSPQS